MWQFAEAVRGLADACMRARHPGHRRQRLALQPDRRDRHPADPRRRRPRRDPGRHGVVRRLGLRAGRRRADRPARHHPRGALRLGAGARRPRPPRRPAAGRSTSPPSSRPRPEPLQRPRRASPPAPTTSPTAASRRPSPRPRCVSGVGVQRRRSRATPSSGSSPSPRPAPSSPSTAWPRSTRLVELAPRSTASRAARIGVRRVVGDVRRRSTASSRPARRRAPRRLDRRPLPPPWAEPGRRLLRDG